MIYYGTSPTTQILAAFTIGIVVLDLVLGVVAGILVRKIGKMQKGKGMKAHETIHALGCCLKGPSDCLNCPFEHYPDCEERLAWASYRLMTDQQKLIAKYGKMFMGREVG